MENQKVVLKTLVEYGKPLTSIELQKRTGLIASRLFRTLQHLKNKGLVIKKFIRLPDKWGRMGNQALISINPRNEEYIIMRLKKDGEILQ